MTTTTPNKKNIPLDLSKTHGTFTSFSDLGAVLGVKPAPAKKPKAIKCKKCGGEMTQAGNSNVFVCNNEIEREIERDGEKVKVKKTCGNYFIKKATA